MSAGFSFLGQAADPPPVVTVTATDATAGEPGTGQGSGTFTFSRTGSTAATLKVNFSVGGTATSGTDYTSIRTSATFLAGSTTANKTVNVNNDPILERDETVVVTLASGSDYTIGSPDSATVTIQDDEVPLPVVRVTATDPTAGEPGTGQGSGTFTFGRTGPATATQTVKFTVGGTATSGTDYGSIGISVTFAAGSSTATKTVEVHNDPTVEGHETVIVNLVSASAYTVGRPARATVTIQDDDIAVITVTATDAAAGEPGSGKGPGPMNAERAYHRATRLADGKVLVAGGEDDFGDFLASADLYNPATEIWTATGFMNSARSLPMMTLLPNGKVLVAGGWNYSYLTSAELYTPATGTWTATGSMSTGREGPAATLLSNGKVLVAGGYNSGYLASAELYNPATGTWTTTGSMNTPRSFHTATLLSNGKVLVAGDGYTAELYDPATGLWTVTGAMNTVREIHTATLLSNGKVLVAGHNSDYVASAELYDPATGIWTVTGAMNTARLGDTATLLSNGKVLVAGGLAGVGLSSTELYDPATGMWTITGELEIPRWHHTVTLLSNGKVLVAGGLGTASSLLGPLASAELYDPATGMWTTGTGTFAFSRSGWMGALTVNFTAGGMATSGTDYASIGTTVSFADGSTTETKIVKVLDDAPVEGNETVVVTLASGSGYLIDSPASATVTIQDDTGMALGMVRNDSDDLVAMKFVGGEYSGETLLSSDSISLAGSSDGNTFSVIVEVAPHANAKAVLRLVGKPGERNDLESSDDLVNWSPVRTHVVQNEMIKLHEAPVTGSGQKFYRLLSVPTTAQ